MSTITVSNLTEDPKLALSGKLIRGSRTVALYRELGQGEQVAKMGPIL
jgi:hypothetical protein